MSTKIYQIHIWKADGEIYTAKPAGLNGWTDSKVAKTEAMRLVGIAGFECKCTTSASEHIAGCGCPCHIVKVIVTEEQGIAAYNGPASRPGKG